MSENRYNDIETFLNTIPQYAAGTGIERAKALLDKLGHPERSLNIIHVAGSNGKGSVCAYLNSILTEHGFNVGLFTSPHLTDMRERIRVNGEIITKEELVRAFDVVYNAAKSLEKENIYPAYFEWFFGMALLLFVYKKTDFVILETGLGGRLDATNAVEKPVMTIITTVSLEHTAILGNTISQIAVEKAGIIKSGVPIVYLDKEKEAADVFKQIAKERSAGTIAGVKSDDYQILKNTGKRIDFLLHNGYYKNDCFSLSTGAVYQAENSSLALTAAKVLQKEGMIKLDDGKLKQAVLKTEWEGRMEEVMPDIYIDGAHNPEGIDAFIESARSICKERQAILLFSVVKDKNFEYMIQKLTSSGLFSSYIVAQLHTDRQLGSDSIKELFARYTSDRLYEFEESRAAFAYGERLQKEQKSILLCTGSLYLAGEIKNYLHIRQ